MKKFEYKWLIDKYKHTLEDLGKEGWEVCGIEHSLEFDRSGYGEPKISGIGSKILLKRKLRKKRLIKYNI